MISGAPGLEGRRLVEVLKEDLQVFGIARSAQTVGGVRSRASVEWLRADICDPASPGRAFDHIGRGGGALFVLHDAACTRRLVPGRR